MRVWWSSEDVPRKFTLPQCVYDAVDEARREKLSSFELSPPIDRDTRQMGIRMFGGVVGKDIDLHQDGDYVKADILNFVRMHSL